MRGSYRLSKHSCRGEHCSPVPVCLARNYPGKCVAAVSWRATNGRPYTRNKAKIHFFDSLNPKYFGQPHSSLPHRLRAEPPRRGGQVPQHTTVERTLHHGRAKFLGYAAHQARQPDEIRHHRCGLPYAARRGRTIPVDLIAGKSLRCGRGYDFPFLPRLGL